MATATPAQDAKQKRAQAAAEYEEATKGLKFSKDFNSNLEAIIADPMATWAERVTCWLKRYAWGEYSLYAIRQDGDPRTLSDAARELCRPGDKLRSVRSRVSDTAKYLETRGYLKRDGEKLYPVIDPRESVRGQKVYGAYSDFSAFMEQYKAAHSDTFAEYEAARSRIKEIRKDIISEFKKFRKSVRGASDRVYGEQVTECTGSVQLSGDVSLLPKNLRREEEDLHAHEALVTNAADPARACPPSPSPEPATPEPDPTGEKVYGAYSDFSRPDRVRMLQASATILTPPLKRLDEFLAFYPDKSDPDATARQYARSVKPETEDACHACLTRYLKSDRVARNVVMKGPRWLREQARNQFHGQWAPPPKPAGKSSFVDNVTRLMGQSLAKDGKPW